MTENCVVCGKALKEGAKYFVLCQAINYIHGTECRCDLPIGSECMKKYPGFVTNLDGNIVEK